jgi:hypothetical protein
MKKFSLFAIVGLSLVSNSAFSQDTTRTLFSTPKINTLGLYVAPEYQFGQIQNELTHLSGFSAMAIVNKKLSVGVSMNRTLVRDFSPKDVSPLYLKANYGGLKIEYTMNPNSLVHISFPLMVGMGMASTDSIAGSGIVPGPYRIRRNTPDNRFFMVQPGVQVEVNLMKYAKAYVGAQYRFAFDTGNSTTLNVNTLKGFGVYAGLKIGLFDYNLKKKTNK